MLVLTRRIGEEIDVTIGGETLRVRITAIDGHKVRLSFAGPTSIMVHRREVSMRIAAGELQGKGPVKLPT